MLHSFIRPGFVLYLVVTLLIFFGRLVVLILMFVHNPILSIQSVFGVISTFGLFLLFLVYVIYHFFIWRVANDKLVCYGVDESSAIALVRRHGQDIPYRKLARAWYVARGNWALFTPIRDQILDPFFSSPTELSV